MPTDKPSKNSSITSGETKPNWREEVLNGLLRGIFIFGLFAVLISTKATMSDASLSKQAQLTFSSIYIASILILGAITFVHRIPYALRAGVLLFLLYGLGLSGLTESGLSGDGRIFILVFPIMAAILFDKRLGFITLFIGVSTLAITAFAFSSGRIYIPAVYLANSTSLSAWISGSVVLLLLAIATIIPITYLIQNLEIQIIQTNDLLKSVESEQRTLEQIVEERTEELEHRARQLENASQVAHSALVFQNVSELLSNVTDFISEKFGYYHAGIFLLDDKKEYAILQAASSDGGKKMLGRGHQLRVGGESIVGATAAEKRPHIALDVGVDAVFFNNPDLPETHSEMALPLLSQNNVVGILDVQSTKIKAFNQHDLEIFQTLANQLALAIQNAHLLEETQTSIAQLEALTAKQSQVAWQAHLEHQSHRYLYTPLGIKHLKRQQLLSSEENDESVNIPIALRGKAIGNIMLKRLSKSWSGKEKALISDISEQVGLAIENARLVDETRKQATQDQLVSEFSTKLRETLDMDTVVKTAIEEIKKTFNLKEVEVRLNTPEEDEVEN